MLYIIYIYKEQQNIAFYKSVFLGFTHFWTLGRADRDPINSIPPVRDGHF